LQTFASIKITGSRQCAARIFFETAFDANFCRAWETDFAVEFKMCDGAALVCCGENSRASACSEGNISNRSTRSKRREQYAAFQKFSATRLRTID
jgi:hypothetical protein